MLISGLFLGFMNCSSEDEPIVEVFPKKPTEINPLEAYIPLKKKTTADSENLLGKGYDFTGAFISDASVRELIIDVDKFIIDNPERYYRINYFISSGYSRSGPNAQIYAKSLTSMSNDNYWNPIPDSISAFTGTILDNKLLCPTDNLLDFSFASDHLYSYKYRYSLNTHSDYLFDYLTDTFKADLELLTSAEIIEKYGTHILLEYIVGLRLDLIYRSKIPDASKSPYHAEECVEAGLKDTMLKMHYWSYQFFPEPNQGDVELNGIPILYVENHGGDNSLIPSGTYNLQKGYPRIDVNKWLESGSKENFALVNLYLDKQYPIYELIKDSKKKAELKQAIDKYIEDRQFK